MTGAATAQPPASRARGPVFYYDLGDPGCYLAAEAISFTLPVVVEWEPVLAAQLELRGETGRGACPADRERIERLALELGIQPVRWPERWPVESRLAMLAATYAKRIGRVAAFSLAAFRQAFAGGHDLGAEQTVLIAAAACEIHPAALLKGIATRAVIGSLDDATARARRAGIRSLPAIQVGGRLFEGGDALPRAARALREARPGTAESTGQASACCGEAGEGGRHRAARGSGGHV